MSEQKQARRVIDAWTSQKEKRALCWMAERLPRWMTPDHLTVLAFISAPIIFAGYALTRLSRWWILVSDAAIILHWWADSMDGTLARVRHRERERYGYFVDHLSDAWATPVICLGLAAAGITRVEVAFILSINYLMFQIFIHVSTYAKGIFKISFGRIGPTEMRIILLLAGSLFIFWNPVLIRIDDQRLKVADTITLVLCVILQIVLFVTSVKTAVELDREDRRKWAS